MDGRLNLNAHGTREMLGYADANVVSDPTAAASPPPYATGQGYGPAEVWLQQGLTSNMMAFTPDMARQMFAGILTERYQPQFGQTVALLGATGSWPIKDPSIGAGQNGVFGADVDALRYPGHLYGLPDNFADLAGNNFQAAFPICMVRRRI